MARCLLLDQPHVTAILGRNHDELQIRHVCVCLLASACVTTDRKRLRRRAARPATTFPLCVLFLLLANLLLHTTTVATSSTQTYYSLCSISRHYHRVEWIHPEARNQNHLAPRTTSTRDCRRDASPQQFSSTLCRAVVPTCIAIAGAASETN
jgi:hypothetical protein